jgi:hypothetical protein
MKFKPRTKQQREKQYAQIRYNLKNECDIHTDYNILMSKVILYGSSLSLIGLGIPDVLASENIAEGLFKTLVYGASSVFLAHMSKSLGCVNRIVENTDSKLTKLISSECTE